VFLAVEIRKVGYISEKLPANVGHITGNKIAAAESLLVGYGRFFAAAMDGSGNIGRHLLSSYSEMA